MDDKEYWKLWATGQPPTQSFKPTPPDGFIQPGSATDAQTQIIEELDLRLDGGETAAPAAGKPRPKPQAQSGPSAAQSFAKQSTSQPFPRPSQAAPLATPAAPAPKQQAKQAGALAKPQGPQATAKPLAAQPFGRPLPQELPTAPRPAAQQQATAQQSMEPEIPPPPAALAPLQAVKPASAKGFSPTTESGKPLAKPSSPYDIIKPRPSQETERKPVSQPENRSGRFKSQSYDMSSIATPPKEGKPAGSQ